MKSNISNIKKNLFIAPYKKEFIFPKKFIDSFDLEIESVKVSSSISLPVINKRNYFFIEILRSLFKKKNSSFFKKFDFELKSKKSVGLINLVKTSHITFSHDKKSNYPEIEYKIINNFSKKNKNIASFLYNPTKFKELLLDKEKINKEKFKCIDYTFLSNSTGGMYFLPNGNDYIKQDKKYMILEIHNGEKIINCERIEIPNVPNNSFGIFLDYSYISKNASHFIVVSPFSWITYSINLTLNSLSLEHTLHPGYFIKKND